MYLFRLHIRPQGGTSRCEKQLLITVFAIKYFGVGWRLNDSLNTADAETYLKAAE